MRTTRESLGEKIIKMRKAAKLSQEALAERSKVPRRTIQNIEYGATTSPELDTLRGLAQALGVSAAELIADESALTASVAGAADLLMKFSTLSPVRQKFVLAVIYQDESYLTGEPLLAQAYRSLARVPGKV